MGSGRDRPAVEHAQRALALGLGSRQVFSLLSPLRDALGEPEEASRFAQMADAARQTNSFGRLARDPGASTCLDCPREVP